MSGGGEATGSSRSTTEWIRRRFREAAKVAESSLPPRERFPDKIGGYRILGRVGSGAIAHVYRAEAADGRTVALKVIRPDQAGPDAEAVFRREAAILKTLRHPDIITLHAMGYDPAGLYLVMDYVEGPTFQALLDERPPRAETLPLLIRAGRAVQHAHEQGIIHRDLKPQNILIGPDGPVITDFGIARALDAVTRTAKHVLKGTPTHMAPEQIDRRLATLGPATDVWALGVMLFQVLCGRLPFSGADSQELFAAILGRHPQPPREVAPDVPEWLEAVCLKALSKRVAGRYSGAGAFVAALEMEGRGPAETPRNGWWRRLFGGGRG